MEIGMIDRLTAEPQESFGRLVLDIETAPLTQVGLEIEQSIVKPSGNFRDTTDKKTGEVLTAESKKQAQIEMKRAKVPNDDGKLDSNPIGCIGVEADGELFHFSTFTFSQEEHAKFSKVGVTLITGGDEADMLKKFRKWCENENSELTRTLSWNGCGFDLRHIRMAYARNHISIPSIFAPYARNWHVDLQKVYCEKFTVNNAFKLFTSLPTACKVLKIHFDGKEIMTGADVPGAIAAEDFFRVTKYNLKDVIATSQVGELMGF